LMTPEQLKEMIRAAIREEMGKRDSVKVIVNTVQATNPATQTVTVQNGTNRTQNVTVAQPDIQVVVEETPAELPAEQSVQIAPRQKYQYESVSVIGGVSFPDLGDLHPSVGLRVPFRSPFKALTIVPEASYDLNDKNLNLGVYGVRPFLRKRSLKLRPYYGVGAAYQGFDVNNASTSNIKLSLLGGTEFDLRNGLLFADYTNYALKSAHRVMLGYRLPF
jgi:hypothetical protein